MCPRGDSAARGTVRQADDRKVDVRTPKGIAVLTLILTAVLGMRLAGPAAPAVPAGAAPPVDGAVFRLDDAEADAAGAARLPAATRRAGPRFAAGVHPQDQAVILAAITSARPEAQRLIGAVDGLVDFEVGEAEEGAVGSTYFGGGSERYRIVLELGPIHANFGQRGVNRLVLHELAHVVDRAILPAELDRLLDRGMQHRGPGCMTGTEPDCPPREECFAESFAKWATGDIGLALPIGYSVPPPEPTPQRWGEPLAELAMTIPQ